MPPPINCQNVVKGSGRGAENARMHYVPSVGSPDPFAPASGSHLECEWCKVSVEVSDVFCRNCGEPGPAASIRERAIRAETRPSSISASSTGAVGRQSHGAILTFGALLIIAGCKFPWIAFDGGPFGQLGVTPPFDEIWQVAAAAAFLAVLGLMLWANPPSGSGMWVIALLATIGTAALMFPRYQEVTQAIVDADGMGVTHGLGLWMVAGGIIACLVAGAAGQSATARRRA